MNKLEDWDKFRGDYVATQDQKVAEKIFELSADAIRKSRENLKDECKM